MILSRASASAALLIGLAGSAAQVRAQYQPAPPSPPAAVYAAPADVAPARGPQVQSPPGAIYREGLPPPGAAAARASEPRSYEPTGASRPYYSGGAPATAAVLPGDDQRDGIRPPLPIGPGDRLVTGAVRDARSQVAALPPDIRPEAGPVKALPPQFQRRLVDYRTNEPAGTIIIDTPNTYLYLVLGNGQAIRYGVGVGREGFTWAGIERVSKMAEWPDWNPPTEMIERQPYLPRFMAGGETNPLGARALYLGRTIYRIHGTNQPSTIGTFVSSGCIRLTNDDVTDLYRRVNVGTHVVVLPGRPPVTAAAPSLAPLGAAAPPPRVAVPFEASRVAPPAFVR
jgi:lipoprotein-anchoring transpeptidase ErfK/SrfK